MEQVRIGAYYSVITSIRASKRRGAAARTAATQDLQVVENPHPDLHLGLHPKEDNATLFSPDSVVQY